MRGPLAAGWASLSHWTDRNWAIGRSPHWDSATRAPHRGGGSEYHRGIRYDRYGARDCERLTAVSPTVSGPRTSPRGRESREVTSRVSAAKSRPDRTTSSRTRVLIAIANVQQVTPEHRM